MSYKNNQYDSCVESCVTGANF